MPTPLSEREVELRSLISVFLSERLASKLEKLPPGDPRRAALEQGFEYGTWIEDAARRVSQIQAVTHSLKPIHPDAKGTNLYCPPTELPTLHVVGSHCLGNDFVGDAVGNAAALDVYKFLKLVHQGKSLLELALARDRDFTAALSDDPNQAGQWISAFAGLTQSRGKLASHTHAKQLYWLVGDDPQNDEGFHLLAPLYASSLAHKVYQIIQDDRFSDAAKEAREAQRQMLFSEQILHEYLDLAIQKLGGTNNQNIGQLNVERDGTNYLLASLPPIWRSIDVKPLLGVESIFDPYGRGTEVRRYVRELRDFLRSDPARILETRQHRDELVATLIEKFLQFSAGARSLPPGWSQTEECRLSLPEKHWLDSEGVAASCAANQQPLPTDTSERIAAAFANWLNARLRDVLPVGDPEFLHWRKLALEAIKADNWEVDYDL